MTDSLTADQTAATGFALGDRVNHIGQRDAVLGYDPQDTRLVAVGTVVAFHRSYAIMSDGRIGISVTVQWDTTGTDTYRPEQITKAA